MEGSLKELSKYRFQCACEDFEIISRDMAEEQLERAEDLQDGKGKW